jgi:hypothetical protein
MKMAGWWIHVRLMLEAASSYENLTIATSQKIAIFWIHYLRSEFKC